MAASLEPSQYRVDGWQMSRALQGRLRRDDAIVQLSVIS
jgi:hypothetical protein